ncbi:MAG: alpha/beta hydrolase [Clostridiales bacterium]|nr:alpha/beta hydrolase [Clostridiales bacterium]
MYYPLNSTKQEKLPVYFEIHGGGFVSGLPHRNDEYCQRLSNKVNAIVININYRLAP